MASRDGNRWVLGAGTAVLGRGSCCSLEEHSAGAPGGLRGTGTAWSSWLLLGQSVSTQHLEVRFTAVPSGVVCVAAHLSLCCFVLFLLLSLALYSSCNHLEKNYSCKMQTE